MRSAFFAEWLPGLKGENWLNQFPVYIQRGGEGPGPTANSQKRRMERNIGRPTLCAQRRDPPSWRNRSLRDWPPFSRLRPLPARNRLVPCRTWSAHGYGRRWHGLRRDGPALGDRLEIPSKRRRKRVRRTEIATLQFVGGKGNNTGAEKAKTGINKDDDEGNKKV